MKNLEYYKSRLVAKDGKYLSAYNHIVKNKPKFIVEYGGGKSTYDLTELVNFLDYGGKVVGYECNSYWYNDHIEKGWNKYNNIKRVDNAESTEFNTTGVRYIHPIEDIKEVDFVILDGPNLRDFESDPNTTFNLMDIVNHLGYEIPYFIDGRTGTRDFYKKNPERPDKFFSCNYKTDVGDKKNEINS